MSFAKQYLKLLEKYENISTDFKSSTVTSYFGIATPCHDIESVIHQYNANEDYCDPNDVEFSIDDVQYYYENYGTSVLKANPLDNLNASFENYLLNCFPDIKNVKDFKYLNNVDLLLATFYLSAVEYIEVLANQDYNEIKNKYPNQSFYPTLSLNLSDVAYYESSKCW